MIDWQSLAIALLVFVSGIGGWFLRELWGAVKELRRDMETLTKNLPDRFVRREDYREDIRELKEVVHEIWHVLKEKADK